MRALGVQRPGSSPAGSPARSQVLRPASDRARASGPPQARSVSEREGRGNGRVQNKPQARSHSYEGPRCPLTRPQAQGQAAPAPTRQSPHSGTPTEAGPRKHSGSRRVSAPATAAWTPGLVSDGLPRLQGANRPHRAQFCLLRTSGKHPSACERGRGGLGLHAPHGPRGRPRPAAAAWAQPGSNFPGLEARALARGACPSQPTRAAAAASGRLLRPARRPPDHRGPPTPSQLARHGVEPEDLPARPSTGTPTLP